MTRDIKVVFHLEQDADGYPPAASESMWAKLLTDGEYEIGNIPFFVKGVSLGDVVSATRRDGELWFVNVLRYSRHSTVRVLLADADQVGSFREEIGRLGCSSELSHNPRLVAVDIPPSVPYASVEKMLAKGEANGRWEYEEAAIWDN